ncbi:MAG: aminodeoxychorismate/anthranilate synthase component II [Nannocystaceae bacterium]|nr:aminodeoxychorismate/anthranilate synthase component II [Nannocystaceae bacterium]
MSGGLSKRRCAGYPGAVSVTGFHSDHGDHSLGRRYEPREPTGPRVLVVDAHDSFTYSLVQLLLTLGAVVNVVACDDASVSVAAVVRSRPTHILLSPGPGRPEHAGIFPALVRDGVADEIPLLGVCLGHQALCQVHGAQLVAAERIMHGKVSRVTHDGTGLFAGLPNAFAATRYHSLVVRADTLPATLVPVAFAEDGALMAVAHVRRPAFGVQFHPESILTDCGRALLERFLAEGNLS